MIKSNPLHMKYPQGEVAMREGDEGQDAPDGPRKSQVRLSRSRTNAQSFLGKNKKKFNISSMEQLPVSVTAPTTPISTSTENILRKKSLNTTIKFGPDELQRLSNIFTTSSERADSMQDSIGEEMEQEAEMEVDESQKTLTSKEGKRLAEEWARHPSIDMGE
jgi:hypothetical protein